MVSLQKLFFFVCLFFENLFWMNLCERGKVTLVFKKNRILNEIYTATLL